MPLVLTSVDAFIWPSHEPRGDRAPDAPYTRLKRQ
jgi:hypothetical protein